MATDCNQKQSRMTEKPKDQNRLGGPVACTALAAVLFCALAFGSRTGLPEPHPGSGRKTEVINLLKSLETGDTAAARVIDPDRYTEHNPRVSDGLPGFLDAVKRLSTNSAKVHTVRVFEDGDFVFGHTDYEVGGPKVGIDIFRFENGKAVEHWDNLQQEPDTANPSGHTMMDGPTESSDHCSTAANKKLVRAFVEDIFLERDMTKLDRYFDGNNYINHNPRIADGVDQLRDRLCSGKRTPFRFDTVHMILAEGDFVLVVTEGSFGNGNTSFYDLFRVQNGKMAEHWDVVEEVPAKSESKNTNGKF
jgi:predicted SnoaL-like aldol condensation-catalyzing enzyme